MPEVNKHIVNEPQPDYEKAEMDLLRDGLKRSPEERFIFLNELIKTQKALQSAKVTHEPEQDSSRSFIAHTDVEAVIFLKQLQKNKVKYLLAGDFAICLYGHDIGNGILEIWIDNSTENLHQLKEAFREHKIKDIAKQEHIHFLLGYNKFSLHNGMRLEIFKNLKGLEGYSFNECLQLASIADIDGVQVPFLHINHLIANKVAVNRPKDQLDVIYLEKIKKMLEDSESGTKL